VIDAASIAQIFGAFMGLWAMGYGIGKSVAWVRHIQNVA
jgi:hypothetical protein